MMTLQRAFFYIVAVSFSLMAQSSPYPQNVFEVEGAIDREVSKVIRKIDPDAYILSYVEPAQVEQKLPGTPFSMKNMTVHDREGRMAIKSITLEIYTRKKEIPTEMKGLIENIVKKYGPSPTLLLKEVPNFVAEEKKRLEMELAELDRMSLTREFLKKNGFFLGLSLLTFLSLLILLLGAVKQGGTKKIQQAMSDGVSRLSEAIENGPSSSMATTSLTEPTERAFSKSGTGEGQASQWIQSFSVSSLAALLTDSYWSEEDGYAAFLWSHIPLEKRKELINQYGLLGDYTAYICGVSPVDLGFHDEPYYLDPLPIFFLDNHQLTEFCRQHRGFHGLLPTLRKQALLLTAKERIEGANISSDKKGFSQMVDALKKKSPSTPRSFKKRELFKIHSIEEEKEILAMSELSWQQKMQIPSLGWLAEFEGQRIEEILSAFSAQDLASAWVAPDHVIEKLKGHIPEKKYQLITSYGEKIPASRESTCFKAIHQMVVKEMESFEVAKEDVLQSAA